jgi:hypothetical protein
MHRRSTRFRAAFTAGSLLVLLPLTVAASDEPEAAALPQEGNATKNAATAKVNKANDEQKVPEINLLEAMQQGLVSVRAEGIGDGRMTLSVTNKSRRRLRVVLPPGIIAQGATGQFGGMGGMGGGMGGMGGGGMGGMGGGGMGGMGGGMGGMGGGMGGGGMGGMGSMGRSAGTMPATMGMMTLARMIMYFCGDPDSWDKRSLMIGMMGGGMGGMGGGMMGGMGGGMGGMGGGMRSVPPSDLPSALLNAGQTRNLPTRLVNITSPDARAPITLPGKGEKLRIVGDIDATDDNPQVRKALKRLTAEMAPTSLTQLVLMRLAGRMEWSNISQISEPWANEYELTLAREFVQHIDSLPEGETGRLLFEVEGRDEAGKAIANDVSKGLTGKTVLGLMAKVGEIPASPDGPAVACRVRLSETDALVQVSSTDAQAAHWVNFGKFTLPLTRVEDKVAVGQLADALSEGILNRLVRAQIIKGSATKDKGKLVYQLRIDNASPLVLNGVAIVGTASNNDEVPKVLSMISISPRKSLTVPTSDEVVRNLGLKKGIKVIALDLSGL